MVKKVYHPRPLLKQEGSQSRGAFLKREGNCGGRAFLKREGFCAGNALLKQGGAIIKSPLLVFKEGVGGGSSYKF